MPDAGFHFTISEGNVVHDQLQVAEAAFLDEEHLLLQAKYATEADAANEPDFDLMAEGKTDLAGQGLGGDAADGHPFGVAVFGAVGVKIELALVVHYIRGEDLFGAAEDDAAGIEGNGFPTFFSHFICGVSEAPFFLLSFVRKADAVSEMHDLEFIGEIVVETVGAVPLFDVPTFSPM